MNNKIKQHLEYSWWKYLAVFLAMICLWMYVFYMIARPQSNEKLEITFIGDTFDTTSLYNDLATNYENITNQSLKQISIDQYPKEEETLNTIINSKSYFNDFMILTEDMLSQKGGSINMHNFTVRIPMEKLRELCGDAVDSFEFFTIDYKELKDMPFGIYLNNPDDGITTRFEQFYKGEKRYVLFFGNDSVNLGQLYQKGNATDRAAIDVLLYFMEEV